MKKNNSCPEFTLNLPDNLKDAMWFFKAKGGYKANIDLLKESVYDMMKAVTQKTAGQKQYAKADHIDWSELDMVMWTIMMEACCLVLSGKLDELED